MSANTPQGDVRSERWFQELFGLDSRSIVLFRWGLGLLIFYDFGVKLGDVGGLYGADGLVPPALSRMLALDGQWSLLSWVDATWWSASFLVLGALLSLCFAAGIRARSVGVLLWVIMMGAHHRNPLILHGGDVLMRLMLFWSLWLPLDRRRLGATGATATLHLTSFNIGIMTQLVVMYLFTGLLKTGAEWHHEGSAVALALADFGSPLGVNLSTIPWLCEGLTAATVWWERLGFLCLFIPIARGVARTLSVGVFIFFHLGLAMLLELGPFPIQCAVMWVLWLPSWFWEQLGGDAALAETNVLEQTSRARVGLAAVHVGLVGLILLWNIGTLIRSHDHIPKPIQTLSRGLGLEQSWRMFAPSPQRLTHTVSFVMKAPASDVVILNPRTNEPFEELTERAARRYGAVRWRKYHYNVAEGRHRRLKPRDQVIQSGLRRLCLNAPLLRDDLSSTVMLIRHLPGAPVMEGTVLGSRACTAELSR